jgi:hypothetical protein
LIDVHTHPVLVEEIMEKDDQMLRVVRGVFGLGNRAQPLETFLLHMEDAGIDVSVIHPIDCTSTRGAKIYSNEQIAELVDMAGGKFIGFASVDPHSDRAGEDLEGVVRDLGLKGLKLAPSIQEFSPDDEKLFPLYERALDLGIPIMMHSGVSFEPNTRIRQCHPMLLEPVAAKYPDLRVCIAHFGWPWVEETAALLLKYPNLYADTSCLYFDTPQEFIQFTFNGQIPTTWIERSLRNQVMFGSNFPRIEMGKMVQAVMDLGFTEGAKSLIFEGNAERFIGI